MTEYPAPRNLEEDELNDMMWDLMDNGTTTLIPQADPDQWIFWLKRLCGFAEVRVLSHTETALILEGF